MELPELFYCYTFERLKCALRVHAKCILLLLISVDFREESTRFTHAGHYASEYRSDRPLCICICNDEKSRRLQFVFFDLLFHKTIAVKIKHLFTKAKRLFHNYRFFNAFMNNFQLRFYEQIEKEKIYAQMMRQTQMNKIKFEIKKLQSI
ncbi:hypothetical protein T03_12227 [Trichinella britovi]|uniref:Uncharacterized protein n=1 Tax=Trichinella britovi TaxID=45882 RepID=A0A0V1CEL5_TRIBR|nr:hypothetical protein T03_12227 [Trichinella britovi]